MKAFGRIFALVSDCHTASRFARVWRRHFYDGLRGAVPSVVLPVAVDFEWARPLRQAPLSPSRDRDTDEQSNDRGEPILRRLDGGQLGRRVQ